MLEHLELWGLSTKTASLIAGALLGAAFGILAQRVRFCLRRGLAGPEGERTVALGVWVMALATAILGTTIASEAGLLAFAEHRFHAPAQPLLAIAIGGTLFGAGMVIARGCVSRLTVLAGSGNMRALVAIVVFAVTAHAAIKGALAPVRTSLASVTVDLGSAATTANWVGGPVVWASILIASLVLFAARSGARPSQLLAGAAIGTIIPLGWLTTGHLLADEFAPIAMESLAFTSASSETLFWWIAGTAIEPGFGVGLFLGVLFGATTAAVTSRTFAWEGFSSETPVQRYLVGGSMMGFGGALAGGCTVGAGLSGIASLSTAAVLILLSIITGALVAGRLAGRQQQSSIFVAQAE